MPSPIYYGHHYQKLEIRALNPWKLIPQNRIAFYRELLPLHLPKLFLLVYLLEFCLFSNQHTLLIDLSSKPPIPYAILAFSVLLK